MQSLTAQQQRGLAIAADLANQGVPIFVAKKSPGAGSGGTGFDFPSRWQDTQPDPAAVAEWRPGDALCAVMGHGVDGLDVDTHKGGDIKTLGSAIPRSYGKQRTRSGGTHDLIASLGLPSKDGILPGIDYKAGAAGSGHGFLFIAPTARPGPDGEMREYVWEVEPDLSMLLIGDDSGDALAQKVQSHHYHIENLEPAYDGPDYADLRSDRQAQADAYREATIHDWHVDLASTTIWDEGQRDRMGRGWEALSRDCAWALARMAACPWIDLDDEHAELEYRRILPAEYADDPKCRGKWYPGLLEKASALPADLPPWWSDAFYETTPILTHIQTAAHSRLSSPDGLLATILARILLEVPTNTVLPPTVGATAPLNLGIALTAKSGGGKSSVVEISREVLGAGSDFLSLGSDQSRLEHSLGSGEGLIDLFLQAEIAQNAKGEMKPTGQLVLAEDPRALITADEVDTLGAIGHRDGSTLFSILRTGLTGGQLGMSNAKAGGRIRRVERGQYRMVLLIGVQPANSGVLLSQREIDSGTPQRFLWANLNTQDLPEVEPEWPGPLEFTLPPTWPDQVPYPAEVKDEIKRTYRKQIAGQTEGHDSHLLLTQLKVAFALAVLHGESEITTRWWVLARQVMLKSQTTQAECREIVGQRAEAQELSSTVRKVRVQHTAEGLNLAERIEKAAQAVIRTMQNKPASQVCKWNDIRPNSRVRAGLDTSDILEEVITLEPRIIVAIGAGNEATTLTYS